MIFARIFRAWGHFPDDVPLYRYLRGRGLLNPGFPPLAP